MNPPSVIDANCLKNFQDERLKGIVGDFTTTVQKIMNKGNIAVDSAGKALQEYNDCCQPSAVGLNLCDWIADRMIEGVVKAFATDNSLNKDLQKLGLPPKDMKWPAIAKGAAADIIVTEDIDLFDPTAKAHKAAKKAKIKETRSGCVCKFLRKNHAIDVLTSAHVRELY